MSRLASRRKLIKAIHANLLLSLTFIFGIVHLPSNHGELFQFLPVATYLGDVIIAVFVAMISYIFAFYLAKGVIASFHYKLSAHTP